VLESRAYIAYQKTHKNNTHSPQEKDMLIIRISDAGYGIFDAVF
jgi:hypothetical protein